MSKGVSREMIRHVIMLVLVILFLALVIMYFRDMAEDAIKILRGVFST